MSHIRNETIQPFFPSWVRRKVLILVLALGLAVCVPGAAAARDSSARKLGRGAANISLGVLAIPGQILQTTRDRGPFIGGTWGFAKGVGFMAASEVIGVFELLSCPFETPPGFRPILKPEFPWQYFSQPKKTSAPPRPVKTRLSQP